MEKVLEINLKNIKKSISDRYKCIFFHIPKTGGSSIRNVLFGNGDGGHILSTSMEELETEKFNEYFKFSFVRNPWDRVVSAFYYLNTSELNPNILSFRIKYIDKYNMNFKKFVKDFMNEESIKLSQHLLPQHLFVFKENTPNIDFIGKFENIQEDFNKICDIIGIDKTYLSNDNKSDHDSYKDYYDEETKSIIAKIYEKDINYFNYIFGA